MKNTLLVLVSILFLACNPSDRSISQQTSNHFSLKTAGNHLSRFDDNSLVWFLQLVNEGVEIPNAIIEKHTLISHPYGEFHGEDLRPVNKRIKAIILKHTDQDCVKQFLLTTDGRKVIDQQLIAETCRLKKGEPVYTYSEYAYVQPNFIGQLTYRVSQDPEYKERLVRKIGFRILPEGNIEKVTNNSTSL